jgi:hypothetical protein
MKKHVLISSGVDNFLDWKNNPWNQLQVEGIDWKANQCSTE